MNAWAITTIYRQFGCPYRDKNFFLFRDQLARQGVLLGVIEITGRHWDFLLGKSDADLLVQLKSDSVLWHKERALNLLERRIPAECGYLAWLDSDAILKDRDWIVKAEHKLRGNGVSAIQLCSEIQFLDKDGEVERTVNTYAWDHVSHFIPRSGGGRREGSPGFAWMMDRVWFRAIGGLYDKCIVGGGDLLFADMIFGNRVGRLMISNGDPRNKYYLDYRRWRRRAERKLDGLHGDCLVGVGQHLWHGEMERRLYGDRHALLLESVGSESSGFVPDRDLEVEWNGLYRIKDFDLRMKIQQYFVEREGNGEGWKEYQKEVKKKAKKIGLKVHGK